MKARFTKRSRKNSQAGFSLIELLIAGAVLTVGFLALIIPGYGLYFWGFGFGVLHISYGFVMYRKYEK